MNESNGIPVAPEAGERDDGFPSRESALELGGISIPGGDEKPKSKRGRKPGQKNKPKDVVAEVDEAAVSFFSETCILVVEAGDEILKRQFIDRIKRYITDETQLAQFKDTLLANNGLTDRDKKLLSSQFQALARKYPVLARFGPELGLTLWALQYAARQFMVLRFIDSLKPKSKNGEAKHTPTS